MKSYEILKFLTVKLTASKISDAEHSTCVATGFYVILNGSPGSIQREADTVCKPLIQP